MITKKNTRVLVSHYNEDIKWIEKLKINDWSVICYNKLDLNTDYTIPLNKGQEASCYLKFIIDHYFNLTDYTILVHGEEYSWHHDGSIVDLIESHIGCDIKFKNINNPKHKIGSVSPEMLPWCHEFFAPEIGPIEQYGDFIYGQTQGAQFVLRKDIILRRSLNFYSNIYKWILDTEITNWTSSRWLEWTWHLIWVQVNPTPTTKNSDKNLYSIAADTEKMISLAKNLIGDDYNVISDEYFVRRLYTKILSREPDAGDFTTYLRNANSHREYKVLGFVFCAEAVSKRVPQKLGFNP